VTRTKPSIAATRPKAKVKQHPDVINESFQTNQGSTTITGDGNVVGDGSTTQVVKVERGTHIEITQVAGDYCPASSVPVPAVAPAPPARFVGRQTYLDALGRDLMAGSVPQAITGMGGIGKTALAQQLALRLADNFPGGVFWADLSVNEGNPMPILAVWARLCGQDTNTLPADPQDCVVVVRGFLAERANKQGRLLIVIDDVREKWLDGALALNRSRPPRAPLLLTTRDNVSATNMGANIHRLVVLPLAEAVELLSRLAGDVIKREEEHARKLATLVDCLPLALELAGKLIALRADKPGWRLADLCEQVASGRADEKLRLRDQPGLAATFSLSYEALDTDQQRLFQALGAFAPVPMTAEHVAIALGDRTAAKAAGDGLDKLVDLSLARWGERAGVAGVHYTMHPLVYEFAARLTLEEERKGFRTPVLNVLREVMCSERKSDGERRDAAYTLTHLRWLDDAADVSADDVSAYMELVGRYLDSPAERRRLVQVITSMLDAQPTRGSLGFRGVTVQFAAFCRHILGKITAEWPDMASNRCSPRKVPKTPLILLGSFSGFTTPRHSWDIQMLRIVQERRFPSHLICLLAPYLICSSCASNLRAGPKPNCRAIWASRMASPMRPCCV